MKHYFRNMSFRLRRPERDLALVVGARAVTLLGDETAALALMLRLQGDGGGPGAVAVLLIAALLPVVLLAPLVGRLVDRSDSRRLLVTTSLLQAGVCTVLAVVTGQAAVLALVLLLGVGQAVNGATWQSLLPGVAGPRGLPRAVALSQTTFTLAGIGAPALAGLLFGLFGARVPLLLDSASFLVVTAAALLVATRRAPAPAARGERARGGLSVVAADPLLRAMLTLLAVFITLGAMVNVVDVFLLRETLGASATWYGAVGASWALGMVGGSTYAGRLRGGGALSRHTVLGAGGLAAAIAGYAAAPSVVWVLPLAVVGGLANGVLNVTTNAVVLARAPEAARGRVSATVGAITSASLIGAMGLGGLVAHVLTPRQVFLAAGLLGVAVVLAFAPRLLKTADSDVITARSQEDGRDDASGRPADPVGSAGDGRDRAGLRA